MNTEIHLLENLVKTGVLKSYSLKTLDVDGNPITNLGNDMRETDELELVFPSGETLVISTFCSGSAENTSLIIDKR